MYAALVVCETCVRMWRIGAILSLSVKCAAFFYFTTYFMYAHTYDITVPNSIFVRHNHTRISHTLHDNVAPMFLWLIYMILLLLLIPTITTTTQPNNTKKTYTISSTYVIRSACDLRYENIAKKRRTWKANTHRKKNTEYRNKKKNIIMWSA